jgi:ribonuclease P protein component
MVSYSFTKEEKLCSQKVIGEMFLSGDTFLCYPLKVVWINTVAHNAQYHVQAAFSVPKRNFKRAHDRNLIRRKIRECYRYQKNKLYGFFEFYERGIAMIIVYIGKEEPEFHQLETAMGKVINKLGEEIKSEKNKAGF